LIHPILSIENLTPAPTPELTTPTLPSLTADLNPEFIAKEKREKKEQKRKAGK